MNEVPFYLFYLFGFLESTAVFYFLVNITRVKWTVKFWLIFALTYPLASFLLRMLPISFGVHSLVLIGLVAVLLHYLYQVKPHLGLISMTLCMVIIILTELLTFIVFQKILFINFEKMVTNNIFWFVSGLPHVVLLFFIGWLLNKYRSK